MFEWASVCGHRPAVMGVVNVTPDSFSNGGRYLAPDAAAAHAAELVAAGADLVDIGGESTRPGADPVPDDEERRRVVPVIERVAARLDVPISADTRKAVVAAAALAAGATIVNDVSAGRHDERMLEVVAAAGAGYIAMHMLGEPATMQDDPRYQDVVGEVADFLLERLEAARRAGVAGPALAADPGIGFGKTVAHNLELLAGLDQLAARVGVPVVVGTSRKRFIGRVLADVGGVVGEPAPPARDDGTLATVVWAVERGARVVRVHDVRGAARAVALLEVIKAAA